VLSIDILGRSAAVEVDFCDVKPCAPTRTAPVGFTLSQPKHTLFRNLS
jgi:hypothetical protein